MYKQERVFIQPPFYAKTSFKWLTFNFHYNAWAGRFYKQGHWDIKN